MTWLDNVFMVSNYKSCSVHPDQDPRLTTLLLRTNKFDWKNMYLLQNHGNLINLFLKSRQLNWLDINLDQGWIMSSVSQSPNWISDFYDLICQPKILNLLDLNQLFACWIYLHFVLILGSFCGMMSLQVRNLSDVKWFWLPDCKTIHQRIISIWTMQNWIKNVDKSVCELF